VTFTRTHVYVEFANPFLRCDRCNVTTTAWHDEERCGCTAGFWLVPCEHPEGMTSSCYSWGPVDWCSCTQPHG
jgi:hypothetical protein